MSTHTLDLVRHELAQVLGVAEEELDPDRPILEFGADSIVLLEALGRLQQRFGVRLRVRQIVEELDTLTRLAAFLAARTATSPPPSLPTPPIPPTPPTLPAEDPESLASELRQIVAKILGSDPAEIGLDDPFLELGGDSIVLVEALRFVEERYGVRLRLRETLEKHATLRGVARHVAALRGAQASPPRRPAARLAPIAVDEVAPAAPREPARGSGPAVAEDFAEAFCARTAGSKHHTEAFRARLSDPRASAGFRPESKELVYPVVGSRAAGARVWDLDGNEYVDVTMGFGTLLFGHAHPAVAHALRRQIENGIGVGPNAFLAGPVAEEICAVTGMERIAFVSSGTEAVMTALRLARFVTGRERIALFRGAYHGFWEGTLVLPGVTPGSAVPAVGGLPARVGDEALLLEWGEESALELVRRHAGELACVLVEPVQSRRPELQPREFLHALRALTRECEVPLVFDEVLTGFRLAPGGAAERFGVRPDLATYGKVLGGGLPIGCVAGEARFLDTIDGGPWRYGDDSRPRVETTFLAGTFAKHPLSLAAAWAVLNEIRRCGPALYARLEEQGARLEMEVNTRLERAGAEIRLARCGSLFRFQTRRNADLFFSALLHHGVYIWEGRTCFLSQAHGEEEIARIALAVERSAEILGRESRRPRATAPPVAPPAPRVEPPLRTLPLTANQRQIWFARRLGADVEAAFHYMVVARLDGALDAGILRETVHEVAGRHESLRTTFDAEGSEQCVHARLPIAFEVHDLESLPATAREPAARARIEVEAGRAFDVERGPLWRILLLREESIRHRLVVSFSDLIADGLSIIVVLEEITRVYDERAAGRTAALPPPLQLHEYLARSSAPEARAEVAAAEQYWLEELAGAPASCALPTCGARPPVKSFAADRVSASVSPESTGALRSAGRARGTTFFATLLAGFAAFLHRITGEEDLVIGIPTLGRSGPRSETLVANCANPVPVRVRIDGDLRIRELVRRVQGKVLDGQDYAACPIGELAHRLAPQRDATRAPLFQVSFNLEPVVRSPRFESGLEATFEPAPRLHGIMDLAVQVTPLRDGSLDLSFDFDPALFDRTRIQAWLGYYREILSAISCDEDPCVAELRLASAAETRLSAELRPPGTPERLESGFAREAARRPEAIALVHADGRTTYGALARRAEGVARVLADRGVRSGDLVGLCLDRCEAAVVSILALWRLGAAYVAIDPELPLERRLRCARIAQLAAWIVDDDEAAPDSRELPVALVFETLADTGAQAPAGEPRDPAGLAYGIFTSGSTGAPKCVLVPHQAVWNLAHALRQRIYAELGPGPLRVAVNGPLGFDTSVKQLVQLLFGHELHLVPAVARNDPERMRAFLIEHRVDVLDATPTQAAAWLAHGLLDDPAAAPRALLLGGEAVEPASWRRFAGLTSTRVFNLYGPTECTVDATVARIEGEVPHVGRALPHASVYVLDRRGRPVPPWVRGEIHVGGEGVAWGYRGASPDEEACFAPDPFRSAPRARMYRTGDVGRFRPDGCLELLGRLDDQVKVSGVRIELREVEAELEALPGVAGAAAAVVANGEAARLVALVASRAGWTVDASELREQLAARVPAALVPSVVRRVETLPLTRNGKLDRRAVAKQFAEEAPLCGRGGRPSTSTEEALAPIWLDVLAVPELGRDDSFFDLGGDSFSAVRLVARASERMARDVPLRSLFLYPTLAGFAQRIDEQDGRPAAAEPAVASTVAVASDVSHVRLERRPLLSLVASGRLAPVHAAALACLPPEILRFARGDERTVIREWCQDLPVVAAVRSTPHGRLALVLLPRFATQLYGDPQATLDAVLDGLAVAASLGARTASLTGLLPSATRYGHDVVAAAAGRALPRVTTGHATTAAAVVLSWRALAAAAGRGIAGERVAFLGLGSVGSAALELALAVLPHPATLVLCDVATRRSQLEELALRARRGLGFRGEIRCETSRGPAPDAVYACSTIVGATNTPAVLDVERLRPGTLVVDDSAPHCFETQAAARRLARAGDLLFAEGGLLSAPKSIEEVRFLPPGAEAVAGPEALELAARVDPHEITGCSLSALLAGDGIDLPPTLGLPDLEECRRHFETLEALGYQAARLRCDEVTPTPEELAAFRARFSKPGVPR